MFLRVYSVRNLEEKFNLKGNLSGSNNATAGPGFNTARHYLAGSHFVSQYQIVRSLAEELSMKYNKSLEEIRLWMRYNEVCTETIDWHD